jgi:hypothetical protein
MPEIMSLSEVVDRLRWCYCGAVSPVFLRRSLRDNADHMDV